MVEVRAGAAARIKSVAADRPELAVFGVLDFHQPAQCFETSFERRLLAGTLSAQNQRVGQLGVVVRQHLFKPRPVRLAALSKRSISRVVSTSRV